MSKKNYSCVEGAFIKKKAKPRVSKKYRIIDSLMKQRGEPIHRIPEDPMCAWWLLFEGTKSECKDWIMTGMAHTEGAERDHYVDLLLQLEEGKTELDYRRV